ncbi:MAG: helix-hairpin-helix domain-containing protein [Planctomycetaceae bacterium]|nr:helix-hairpin-helix domain-containing protein [Planctomycetaceae bacterium]
MSSNAVSSNLQADSATDVTADSDENPVPHFVPESSDTSTISSDKNPDAPAAADLRFLRIILTVFAAVFGCQWLMATRDQPTVLDVERGAKFEDTFRVNVNTASWIEWMQLEQIGITLAHRIVADRELNGPFTSVDDLRRVSGIGERTLEQIRPWLTISHEHEETYPEFAR